MPQVITRPAGTSDESPIRRVNIIMPHPIEPILTIHLTYLDQTLKIPKDGWFHVLTEIYATNDRGQKVLKDKSHLEKEFKKLYERLFEEVNHATSNHKTGRHVRRESDKAGKTGR